MSALQALTLAMLAHIVLTTAVGIGSLRRRIRSAVSGETRLGDIALDSSNWPDAVKKFSNNFDNQFQVPMLWYAVSALSVAAGKLDWVLVVLSCMFVVARAAHSFIHTGSNDVPLRMRVFLAGFAVVVLMWLWFAMRVFEIA
jgi:hypothetical protein